MPSVTFDKVTKRFGDVRVVEEFNLEVAEGELLVLVGGSGSGKSTILRMVAGLDDVSSGTIRIDDRDITHVAPRERDVAMVFQDYALYPHLTVRENLSLGLRLRKIDKAEIARRVEWATGMLGLAEMLERKPKQLSGGQRQRVAMGRAMVREPLVFLFDEPLSNLDAGLRAQMRIEIGGLQRRLHTTTIYVTHDQVEAMTLGDRIVVLANGRIQQVGTPIDLYRAPANRFVAGFIGTPPMNFLDGTLREDGGRTEFVADGVRIALPSDRIPASAGAMVTFGVRPEDLRLVSDASASTSANANAGTNANAGINASISTSTSTNDVDGDARIEGRVVLVERLGGTSHIHIAVGATRMLAAVSHETLPSVGEVVTLQLAVARAHLFDAAGHACRMPLGA